jgi:arabinose-5-phosphate isomerase
MITSLKEIIEKEIQAIRGIPLSDAYERVIDLIFSQVHQKNGKLVCSGMGKAGQIASTIATTFSSTGTPAYFLHPSDAQHGDLGILRENDLMLLISNSGKTREIIELVGLARQLVPNIRFIVVTSNETSELAKSADICLLTGNPPEVCALGLTPTTSTSVMKIIGDLLVVETMKRIGFTTADYAKRHHGGYLGAVSRMQSKESS